MEIVGDFTLIRAGFQSTASARNYQFDQLAGWVEAAANQRSAAPATAVERDGDIVKIGAPIDAVETAHDAAIGGLGAP